MFAAILAAALGLTGPAAPPSTRTVRVFYTAGLGSFRVSFDAIDALEEALQDRAAGAKLESVSPLTGYVSRDEFLFAASTDVAASGAPAPSSAAVEGRVQGIATAKEILFVDPEAAPLLDEVFKRISDPADWDRFVPSARKTALELRGYPDGSRSALIDGGAPAAAWAPTAGFAYRVRIGGQTVTVYAVGRVLGGPGVVDALKERLAEEPGAFLLHLGGLHVESRFGLPKDLALKTAVDVGFSLLALSSDDVLKDWDEIQQYTKKDAPRMKLLCTNLKASSPDAPPIERIHIEELGGLRVAFLSLWSRNSSVVLRRKAIPYTVEDPVESADDAVREARGLQHADLVVLVARLSGAEERKLLDRVEGIDVLLGDVDSSVESHRRTSVDLENWSKELHLGPALRPSLPRQSYSELAFTFAGRQLVRIDELPGPEVAEPSGGAAAAKTELSESRAKVIAGYMSTAEEPVLPDPRMLWPDVKGGKLQYEPAEFWNIAAASLRRRSGAEIALLRISPLASNIPGGPREVYVREWLDPDPHPVVVSMPGRALQALLERMELPGRPISATEIQKPYASEVWVAASGIDSKGRVSGLPVNPDEAYSVATTQELLEHGDELPALNSASGAQKLGPSLANLLLSEFKAERESAKIATAPASGYPASVRKSAEGETPVGLVWRFDLRDLSFQFADTQVANNQPFTQVRDARIQSTSQVLTQGDVKLFSEMYYDRFRWDTGVTAAYGRVTLEPPNGPNIVNTTQDDVLFSTELRHRTWALEKDSLRPSLGPFFNVSYETQFTQTDDVPKAQYMRYRTGLKISDGKEVHEAYLGPAAETDYSTAAPRTHYGYAAGIAAERPLGGSNTTAKLDASYLEIFSNSSDEPQDLRRRFLTRVELNVPLYKQLALKPFVDLYVFQGLTVHETGTSLLFGITVSFAHLWKPFF